MTGVLHGHEDEPRQIEHNGVLVTRVASTSYERSELGRRAVNYFSYLGSALRHALSGPRARSRALHDRSADHRRPRRRSSGKRVGAPVLVISQDVFPEIATELDRLRNPAVIGVLRGLVGAYLRRADRIVAIGETMRERLEAKGAPPERLRVIPNWVDTRAITPQPRDNEWARAARPRRPASSSCTRATSATRRISTASSAPRRSFATERTSGSSSPASVRATREMVALAERLEVDRDRALPPVPEARAAPALALERGHPRRRSREGARRLRRAEPALRDPRGRPPGASSRRRTRARRRGSCARSAAASSSRPAGPDLVARTIREAADGAFDLDGDGTARPRVRRGGGGPRRRDGAVSRARPGDARRVIARVVFWGSLGALAWTHAGYPLAMGVLARMRPRPVRKADADAVGCARRLGAQRGGGHPPAHRERARARLSGRERSRSSSPPTDRPISPTPSSARSPPRTRAFASSSARARARSQRSIARFARPRARCSRSPTRTASGSRTRCARSSGTSPTPRSATSAGSSGSRARTARTWRGSTGGTRCGCASRSRQRARSRRGTARSTRSSATRTSRTTRSSATTSASRTSWSRWGDAPSTSPTAVAVEKPAAEPEDEYGRKVRTISRALGHILTGRAFRPTRPLYLAQLVSHRVLRYSTGILHVGLLVSNLMLVARAPLLPRVPRAPARRTRARGSRARHGCRFLARGSPTTTTSSRRRRSRRSSRYLRSGTPQTWDKAKGTR